MHPRGIPADHRPAIQAALLTLQEKLQPHLVDLDAEHRRELSKMAAKIVDFVSRMLGYSDANSQYQPTFADIDELILAEFQYRSDRRFDLRSILSRLLHVACTTMPHSPVAFRS